MSEDVAIVEKSNEGYAVVTLNRPRAMNALSVQLCKKLAQTFRQLAADSEVRVLILTGAGRAFCSGLDLKELGEGASSLLSDLGPEDDPVRTLESFKGPIIGAINGAAITGGFELALACDVLIWSTEARFSDTHARVGVMPGWGLSQKLSRAVGLARARQLAMDMLSSVPHMLVAYKKLIDDGFAMNLADGIRLEREQSQAWNSSVSSQQIEQRRIDLQQRRCAQVDEASRAPMQRRISQRGETDDIINA